MDENWFCGMPPAIKKSWKNYKMSKYLFSQEILASLRSTDLWGKKNILNFENHDHAFNFFVQSVLSSAKVNDICFHRRPSGESV